MGSFFLSISQSFPIPLIGLLVLFTPMVWAQRTSPQPIPIQFLDTSTDFARFSEDQTRLHLIYRLSVTFEQNQHQTEPQMKLCFRYPSYDHLLINANAGRSLWLGKAVLPGKEKYVVASALPPWQSFASTSDRFPRATTDRVEDLECYGHHVPWAGPIIAGICQQARAHRRLTRVLMMLQPEL